MEYGAWICNNNNNKNTNCKTSEAYQEADDEPTVL